MRIFLLMGVPNWFVAAYQAWGSLPDQVWRWIIPMLLIIGGINLAIDAINEGK